MDAMAMTRNADYLNRTEAAAYIGVCLTTLGRLDVPRTKIRKKVFYKKTTLDSWLASQELKGKQK